MTTLRLIQDLLMWVAVFSALVIAFWIFPRLFLACYSPRIWQSIRRYPVVHLVWGLAGFLAVYLFFKIMSPELARN